MLGQQIGFVAGRDVQHVKAVLVPPREIHRAPGRNDRSGMIANPAVIGDVGRARKTGRIRPYGRFVLAVGTDRQQLVDDAAVR
jgi:hypothetical protein